MSAIIEYKGYSGSVELSEADQLLYGKVLGIKSLISYEGRTVAELVSDFHAAVDEYLELCKEKGVAPEVAYKGCFNVRVDPEVHRMAAYKAIKEGTSLNAIVGSALKAYCR